MYLIYLDINPFLQSAFAAADTLGYEIVYISESREKINMVKNRVKEAIYTPVINHAALTAIIHSLQQRFQCRPAAVIALKEQTILLAAALNNEFSENPAVCDYTAMKCCKNKIAFRDALRYTKFNPDYVIIGPEAMPLHNPFPLSVIKPPLGHSSIGVELVGPADSFAAALARTRQCLKALHDGIKTAGIEQWATVGDKLLCEEFIGGEEFSVDIFLNQKVPYLVGICAKSPMQGPFFEEISYTMPAPIPVQLEETLFVAAAGVARVIGIDNGPVHFEFKIDGERCIVLDAAVRLGGGGLTTELSYHSSGWNLILSVIAQAVGQDPMIYRTITKEDTSLLFLFQIAGGGKVQQITQQIDFLPDGVRPIETTVLVKEGDVLTPYPNCSPLPGYAIFGINGRSDMSRRRIIDTISLSQQKMTIEYVD